jgi:hypothetical protein
VRKAKKSLKKKSFLVDAAQQAKTGSRVGSNNIAG